MAAPGPPSNIQGSNGTTDQQGLDWDAPANDGGSPITGYQILIRYNNEGGEFTLNQNTGTDNTAWDRYGSMVPGIHRIRIRAWNDDGLGAIASYNNFNIIVDQDTPSAPTGLQVTGNFQSRTLTWNTPSDDGGTPISGYQIQRRRVGTTTWTTTNFDTGSTATTYIDSSTQTSGEFLYQVAGSGIRTGPETSPLPMGLTSAGMAHRLRHPD